MTAEQLTRYARATGHEPADGVPDVPVFGAALALPALEQAAFEVIPEHLRPRGLHAAHMIERRGRIDPGSFTIRTRMSGVRGGRSGARIAVDSETRRTEGPVIEEQRFVVVLRGVAVEGGDSGHQAPARSAGRTGAGEPGAGDGSVASEPAAVELGTFTQQFPAGTAAAYAVASGDHRQIHLDDAVARAHGLPGAITHGLCTLAFVLRGVHELVDPEARMVVRRVAVRFTGIVMPSMSVRTRVNGSATGMRQGPFAFEATADGAPALGGGQVELTEPGHLLG